MKTKVYCMLLALSMLLNICQMPEVAVKAESIYDLSEELGISESVECNPSSSNTYYYEVTLKEKGILTLGIESRREEIRFCFYGANGNEINGFSDSRETKGGIKLVAPWGDYYYLCWWNSVVERMDVSGSWELAAGTYYFKIWGNDGGESATTLTTSFQSTETKAATDITLQLELSVGSSMKLKAVLTPTGSTSKVLWKSSNKTICTVSKSGKVTAVGKGVCTITASANGHKTKIRIKVVD